MDGLIDAVQFVYDSTPRCVFVHLFHRLIETFLVDIQCFAQHNAA